MANKIEVVIQQALRTFSKYIKKLPEFSQAELNELKLLADGITASDIQKFQSFPESNEQKDFFKSIKSSLDYLPVYDDDYITVGVFLLKRGAKLPIHDHPDMYGIIKVLKGILKITSYSLIEIDKTVVNNDQYLFYNSPLKVIKHPEIILKNNDTSCLLTPTEKNFHEVECIEGPAAFLDILSPPYGEGEPNVPRTCHYFEEIPPSRDNICRLVQVRKYF